MLCLGYFGMQGNMPTFTLKCEFHLPKSLGDKYDYRE